MIVARETGIFYGTGPPYGCNSATPTFQPSLSCSLDCKVVDFVLEHLRYIC